MNKNNIHAIGNQVLFIHYTFNQQCIFDYMNQMNKKSEIDICSSRRVNEIHRLTIFKED